jgi:DNA-directed RNA polymerase specialized sigma24 family protein
MPVPRTREELERAANEAETWLDSLDPATTPAEDPADLRRIGLALRELADKQRDLEEAVAAARANGRNWGEIGLVLGISRQSTRERYGQATVTQVTAPRD